MAEKPARWQSHELVSDRCAECGHNIANHWDAQTKRGCVKCDCNGWRERSPLTSASEKVSA